MKPYSKPERYAVVRRGTKSTRYKMDFRKLHNTLESAKTEACRLIGLGGAKYYVVEFLFEPHRQHKVKKDS